MARLACRKIGKPQKWPKMGHLMHCITSLSLDLRDRNRIWAQRTHYNESSFCESCKKKLAWKNNVHFFVQNWGGDNRILLSFFVPILHFVPLTIHKRVEFVVFSTPTWPEIVPKRSLAGVVDRQEDGATLAECVQHHQCCWERACRQLQQPWQQR